MEMKKNYRNFTHPQYSKCKYKLNEYKLFYQFILICIILIFSTIFFKKYFTSEQKVENLEIIENKLDLNVIKDIKYFSKDTEGNTYEIVADSGVTDIENPYLIELKNVKAKIIFDKKKRF